MPDRDHLVHTIARGEHGQLQIRRKQRGREDPVTELRLWYLDEDSGEVRPTKHGLPIRDGELAELIAALQRIEKHVRQRPPEPKPAETRRRHRQRKADGPTGATGPGLTDAELREVDEAF